MRGSDLIGRLGGEEFAVIVAEPMEFAARIAERLRGSFEIAGITIANHTIGATVSIGAAASHEPVTDIAALISRADAALYRAKNGGRNRVHADGLQSPPIQGGVPLAAARSAPAAKPVRSPHRKAHARGAKSVAVALIAAEATPRLPSAR
jgi:hypothetical protein